MIIECGMCEWKKEDADIDPFKMWGAGGDEEIGIFMFNAVKHTEETKGKHNRFKVIL